MASAPSLVPWPIDEPPQIEQLETYAYRRAIEVRAFIHGLDNSGVAIDQFRYPEMEWLAKITGNFNNFARFASDLEEHDKELDLEERENVAYNLSLLTKEVEELVGKLIDHDLTQAMERHAREREPIEKRAPVGRNDPCPCGSGKKYKKCCGAPGALN